MALNGTKTHENLKSAFAGESQANRRYLYFARQADIEGYPEAAGIFKNTADGETGHAFGHLEFMEKGGAGDPGPAGRAGGRVSSAGVGHWDGSDRAATAGAGGGGRGDRRVQQNDREAAREAGRGRVDGA